MCSAHTVRIIGTSRSLDAKTWAQSRATNFGRQALLEEHWDRSVAGSSWLRKRRRPAERKQPHSCQQGVLDGVPVQVLPGVGTVKLTTSPPQRAATTARSRGTAVSAWRRGKSADSTFEPTAVPCMQTTSKGAAAKVRPNHQLFCKCHSPSRRLNARPHDTACLVE